MNIPEVQFYFIFDLSIAVTSLQQPLFCGAMGGCCKEVALYAFLTKVACITLSLPKQQMTKFSSANFQKMFDPSYIILRIQRLEDKQCRSR